MIVTFCGHSTISNKADIENWLFDVTEKLIKEEVTIFYLGGYGEFDNLCKKVLLKHKKTYNFEMCLVVPYINHKMNTDGFDEIIYPEIKKTPPKFAILARNRWIIDKSAFVVSYVQYTFGGAYKTYLYAKNKDKTILNYNSTP